MTDGLGTGPEADALRHELEALVDRYGLAAASIPQLDRLVRLLAFDPAAPTTIRDPRGVLDDHIADSLVALELQPVRAARRGVDLGAGAGLPGLALAIARPELDLTLVESSRRKCQFIARAIAELRLRNATVRCSRAESWADGAGCMDLATARALAPPPVVVEYAAPLLRIGGVLVAWRGRRDAEAEERGARAAKQLGLEQTEILQVQPYRTAQHRHLAVMVKTEATPEGFPRRPGVAARRPLGGRRP